MKIQNALVSKTLDWSQRYFAHVTTVTLSWRVQNVVVIGRVYFTLECFEFSSNFEFDRNMLSGTGTWCLQTSLPAVQWVLVVETSASVSSSTNICSSGIPVPNISLAHRKRPSAGAFWRHLGLWRHMSPNFWTLQFRQNYLWYLYFLVTKYIFDDI